MKSIRVAAAIIKRDNDGKAEIFATQRGYGPYKDWWEFPGGKIEEGESAEEALIREIQEELGVEVAVDELLCSVEYDYPEFHLSMDCFFCYIESGEIKLLEHEAAKWLNVDNLYSVKWLPADDEVLKMIERRLRVITAQKDFINKILHTDYLERAGINEFEEIRERLRNLVKYLKEEKIP